MRGLKPTIGDLCYISHDVAPFTDAWIETSGKEFIAADKEVAPFTDAWIETSRYGSEYCHIGGGRTLYGCVD